jgi:glyoxylase-like metal-dependent hydrolase (beta-lactamase superfamily II)
VIDVQVSADDNVDRVGGGAGCSKVLKERALLVTEIWSAAKNPGAQAAMRAEIALIDAGPALGPTEIVRASGPVTLAGRSLQVHLESHAVTAGDVWLFDPQTRVLLAGDLVTLPAPFFESACPARWRVSLEHLEKTPFERLVPGHGAPMQRPQFTAYRKAFSNLLACAAGKASKVDCIDGWIGDASALIDDNRDASYARTLINYYLENYLRNPSERIRKFCTD